MGGGRRPLTAGMRGLGQPGSETLAEAKIAGETDVEHAGRRRRGVWSWVAWTGLLGAGVLVFVGALVLDRAGPILKGRIIETLSARFDGRVELDALDVSVLHGLEVSGEGLRIFAPDDVVAAGATSPLISIRSFGFHAGLMGLFVKPMHVDEVHVSGMEIRVPPREVRSQGAPRRDRGGKMKILVDRIVCDDSRLVIENGRPGRAPKEFALRHIAMRDVGPNGPWQYDATVVNAIPKGDIHATGIFWPWVNDRPGELPLSGRYTFEHADLSPIKGIGGTLSSVGEFRGMLNRIEVDGTAEVPEFSLDTANHPMPLQTSFHAIVDGTTGDTYLQPVRARLSETSFMCSGSVIHQQGVGHVIDLDVSVPNGRLEDFLRLAVKTRPVVMTARLEMKVKLHIRPGKESVTRRLTLAGGLRLWRIHFNNPEVQAKVDMLSLRAQGRPGEAGEVRSGAEDVSSQMSSRFGMNDGRMRFDDLVYTMPGATMQLNGVYTLSGEEFRFEGKVRTEAKLSQMVTSWWKSLLLRPVDPFFHKHGAGAEIPVWVSGTKGSPKFGLDLFRKDKRQGGE